MNCTDVLVNDLGLKNVSFNCGDARDLKIDNEYDAVLMNDCRRTFAGK